MPFHKHIYSSGKSDNFISFSEISMAGDLVIKDKIFDRRGIVSPDTWSKLSIRGGGSHIDDALKKWGWNGSDPVAVPVISVEPRSKKILGSRWELRGLISKRGLKASSIWPDIEDSNLSVCWDIKGISLRSLIGFQCSFICRE